MARTMAAVADGTAAVDEFGELPGLKRDAERRSARRGHVITVWHHRGMHDPHGREAFCDVCGAVVVVTTEPAMGRPNTYGWTLTRPCGRREN